MTHTIQEDRHEIQLMEQAAASWKRAKTLAQAYYDQPSKARWVAFKEALADANKSQSSLQSHQITRLAYFGIQP